ncbi:uncharacterized protein EV420DRAFT_520710 [Desarmillaria tabescens]|uniref:DUF6534 domain-containing protein n=1 Tax=Armillaria tabescens TaxID=1929756 RepID=A0AA39KAL4_ARMTA|nr:uncharacterized protein EV420DRAFT_520710 [Desarmillaria tabescens]KAK0457328.1 hypothetical protein EV420DRAFT_520710 [Desarmillaria tabescens]
MSSPLPIPIADIPSRLGATLGAIFIGATIAAVFYGITVLQTVVYYRQNPNDPWLFRYAVAVLWIFDTLHVGLSTHALYFYLIKSFGNYPTLFTIVWSFPLQLLFNMLIATSVQALYAVRILKFGRHFHVVMPWFIFLAVAATVGTGLYVIYDTYTLSSIMGVSTIRASIHTEFSVVAVADFVITGAMCFYLHKGRSMTSFSSTTKIIIRLMRLVLVSGLATSACSLFTLVSYIAWPDTLIFVTIDFVMPKLYINSLLAMQAQLAPDFDVVYRKRTLCSGSKDNQICSPPWFWKQRRSKTDEYHHPWPVCDRRRYNTDECHSTSLCNPRKVFE